MTKKEEKQENLNINFKLKLVQIAEVPEPMGKGLYEQFRGGNRVRYQKMSYVELKTAIEDIYYKGEKISK